MAKVGRPSKFQPEYSDLLIHQMEQGESYEEFAGFVRVSIQTLYNWEQQYPEFLEAKKIGVALSLRWWAKAGRDGMYNETIKSDDGMTVTRSLNPTLWIFNMKNRHGWRDKHEIEEIETKAPQKDASQLIERFKKLTVIK